MTYEGYRLITVAREGAIVTATVDNPPINLITLELYGELARLAEQLEADPDARVFVLKSANPEFFLAHFDVTAILAFPVDAPATREGAAHNAYHAMCERFRTMDKVTIARSRAGWAAAAASWPWPSTCASAFWERPSSTRWRRRWAYCRAAAAPSGRRG